MEHIGRGRTWIATDVVETSLAGPHRIATISDVTTDRTILDQGGDDVSDALATIGQETITIDIPAGAASRIDTMLPDS
jgi:hypothetical protein